jgi:geranylgeranyl diphosphate synthase, type II
MAVVLMEVSHTEHVERLAALVKDALPHLVDRKEPRELYEPVRYVLEGEGKRFRPVLLLLAAECYGVASDRALPAALAVEVFHNFTLVHDDIMDHADERRRRPTVHVKWDESTAILCGDLLMALSYDLLARLKTDCLAEILRVYYEMVAQLCEGQGLDKSFEARDSVSLNEYLSMIDRKTGALLCASLQIGGLIGRASDAALAALRALGVHLGRAFQIQDDLLDLIAEDERWGKMVGGDLIEGKKAFLLLSALERAGGQDREWFQTVIANRGLSPTRVGEARERMARLGVLDHAKEAVVYHTEAAIRCIDELPGVSARETLRWLVRRMQERLH